MHQMRYSERKMRLNAVLFAKKPGHPKWRPGKYSISLRAAFYAEAVSITKPCSAGVAKGGGKAILARNFLRCFLRLFCELWLAVRTKRIFFVMAQVRSASGAIYVSVRIPRTVIQNVICVRNRFLALLAYLHIGQTAMPACSLISHVEYYLRRIENLVT